MKHHLACGDRVELLTGSVTTPCGTVEHTDDSHVRVQWDDGKIGLLYYDDNMICNARYLHKLRGVG